MPHYSQMYFPPSLLSLPAFPLSLLPSLSPLPSLPPSLPFPLSPSPSSPSLPLLPLSLFLIFYVGSIKQAPASPNPPPSSSRAICDPTISCLSPSPPSSLLIGGEKERSGRREGERKKEGEGCILYPFFMYFSRFKIKHLI